MLEEFNKLNLAVKTIRNQGQYIEYPSEADEYNVNTNQNFENNYTDKEEEEFKGRSSSGAPSNHYINQRAINNKEKI